MAKKIIAVAGATGEYTFDPLQLFFFTQSMLITGNQGGSVVKALANDPNYEVHCPFLLSRSDN